MRPITAQPVQTKSDTFAPQHLDQESLDHSVSTKNIEGRNYSKSLENKQLKNSSVEKNLHKEQQVSPHTSHARSTETKHHDPLSFYKDKDDSDSSSSSDDDSLDQDTYTHSHKSDLAAGTILPPNVGTVPPPPSVEPQPTSFDAISTALSSMQFSGQPEAANLLTDELTAAQDSKLLSSEQEEGAPLLSPLRMSSTGVDTQSSAPAGVSSSLAQPLPAPVAAAVRSSRFSAFLTELTASVAHARLNGGQDMTLQLRSDVLEGTSIHISGDAAHLGVVFATSSAASNTLLNSQLTTLQNHLATICPGQTIDIKMTQSSSDSSTSTDKDSTSDDLASFDQQNRGDLRNNDNGL